MPRDARAYLADIIESCDAIAVAVRFAGSSDDGTRCHHSSRQGRGGSPCSD